MAAAATLRRDSGETKNRIDGIRTEGDRKFSLESVHCH